MNFIHLVIWVIIWLAWDMSQVRAGARVMSHLPGTNKHQYYNPITGRTRGRTRLISPIEEVKCSSMKYKCWVCGVQCFTFPNHYNQGSGQEAQSTVQTLSHLVPGPGHSSHHCGWPTLTTWERSRGGYEGGQPGPQEVNPEHVRQPAKHRTVSGRLSS